MLIFSLDHKQVICGKLTDFGTCRNISPEKIKEKPLTSGVGTANYMAPEFLTANEKQSNYSYPVDVYAFGIVLYEKFIEKSAFDSEEFQQQWIIPKHIIAGKRFEKPYDIPEQYWNLIVKCWAQDFNERPTIENVIEEMKSWNYDIEY